MSLQANNMGIMQCPVPEINGHGNSNLMPIKVVGYKCSTLLINVHKCNVDCEYYANVNSNSLLIVETKKKSV